MTQPTLCIALVVGERSENEAYAIRAFLECLSVRVVTYWIGRPRDFIEVLSGKALYDDVDYLIFCLHGEKDGFCMPQLGQQIYDEQEPRVQAFGAQHIQLYAKLNDIKVIATGCTLGNNEIADSFIEAGCNIYIAPEDYIPGSAVLIFLMRYFYEIVVNQRIDDEAYTIARSTDQETLIFKCYEK
nr:delta-aminolevulinic acid dehydratase [Acinetobacter sp. Marseille-Q1620]